MPPVFPKQAADGQPIRPVEILGVPLGGAVAWSDKTITNLSGASQDLIVANPLRKGMVFKNGAVAAALNLLGGPAVIGGAACVTLQPYEPLSIMGGDCPQGLVTVIGTATNYMSAFEIT